MIAMSNVYPKLFSKLNSLNVPANDVDLDSYCNTVILGNLEDFADGLTVAQYGLSAIWLWSSDMDTMVKLTYKK